jgi:hypothetical protein
MTSVLRIVRVIGGLRPENLRSVRAELESGGHYLPKLDLRLSSKLRMSNGGLSSANNHILGVNH